MHRSGDSFRAPLGSISFKREIASSTSSYLNAKFCGDCLCKHRSWSMLMYCMYNLGYVRTIFTIMKTICSFLCRKRNGFRSGSFKSQ